MYKGGGVGRASYNTVISLRIATTVVPRPCLLVPTRVAFKGVMTTSCSRFRSPLCNRKGVLWSMVWCAIRMRTALPLPRVCSQTTLITTSLDAQRIAAIIMEYASLKQQELESYNRQNIFSRVLSVLASKHLVHLEPCIVRCTKVVKEAVPRPQVLARLVCHRGHCKARFGGSRSI